MRFLCATRLHTRQGEVLAERQSGAKVEMKNVAQFDVPEEFKKRSDDEPKLAEAFHALTPGRQKGYAVHPTASARSYASCCHRRVLPLASLAVVSTVPLAPTGHTPRLYPTRN